MNWLDYEEYKFLSGFNKERKELYSKWFEEQSKKRLIFYYKEHQDEIYTAVQAGILIPSDVVEILKR